MSCSSLFGTQPSQMLTLPARNIFLYQLLELILVTNLCISIHNDISIMSLGETFVKADNSNCQICCRWSYLQCLPSFLGKTSFVLLKTKDFISNLHLETTEQEQEYNKEQNSQSTKSWAIDPASKSRSKNRDSRGLEQCLVLSVAE